MWPTNSNTWSDSIFGQALLFLSYNGVYLTLIHCCVRFGDLLTGTYCTLRVFRFDAFLTAPSLHQFTTPVLLFVAILRISEEDKTSHLTDGKLPHPHLPSNLRIMTQLTSKRPWYPTLSERKDSPCNWIEKHKATSRLHKKIPKPKDLKSSHDPGSHKHHPSQIPVGCMRLSLPLATHTPPSIEVVVDTIPDNFSHQSGD